MHTISTESRSVEPDLLFAEIARYLAAVEVFREQGYEPRWSSGELGPWTEALHQTNG
jgi:hypothetical protein